MARIIVLGANGNIARIVVSRLLAETDHELALFLRKPSRLGDVDTTRADVFEGDASDEAALVTAMKDVDFIYANLGGNVQAEASAVVAAMKATGVRRFIWISTLGIYDEVPGAFGRWNHKMLDDGYLPAEAAAAKAIEESGLDYTIVRPAWLSDTPEISWETTQKGQPFKGTEVSRASIADFVLHLIEQPSREIGHSVGVNKPGTGGDKPSWY